MDDRCDIAVVGAGAAGLMAAIHAAGVDTAGRGRDRERPHVVALDGARKIGAKILIAGGGRCNVTNENVEPADFSGSSQHSIRKILGRLDVDHTVRFFEKIGVNLKSEPGGKLFPTTDRAATVLNALLEAASGAGVALHYPRPVTAIERGEAGYRVVGDWGVIEARRVILSAGGRSLPSTGSDGSGFGLARSLGHSLTEDVFPALVPLKLPDGHPLRSLSGVSKQVRLEVRSATGARIAQTRGALLCTHFGVSGPAVLDISRHWWEARRDDPGVSLICDWLPAIEADALDSLLREHGPGSVAGRLRGRLPARLLETLCAQADVDSGWAAAELSRASRRGLVTTLEASVLPVEDVRGWNFAEVTAGGVPLAELDPRTLESRVSPGLHFCGEICDVDGRIGGFNFQWAWSSGYVAGRSAAASLS